MLSLATKHTGYTNQE